MAPCEDRGAGQPRTPYSDGCDAGIRRAATTWSGPVPTDEQGVPSVGAMTAFEKLYIDGAWTPSDSTETIDVIDSATEEVMATIPAGTADDVDRAVAAAKAAFGTWSATPVEERAKYLRASATASAPAWTSWPTSIAKETGMAKWLSQIVQVGLPINSFKSAAATRRGYSFEETGRQLARRARAGRRRRLHHAVELPAAPDRRQGRLRAGRRLHGRRSSRPRSPRSTRFILAEVIDEVGLPAGVFNLVSGLGPTVGEAIAAHPDVDMVSFTGSTRAGKRVAELGAENVKRVALELGGKSANVLLDDLDTELRRRPSPTACRRRSSTPARRARR